jgi:hypothetical protein
MAGLAMMFLMKNTMKTMEVAGGVRQIPRLAGECR